MDYIKDNIILYGINKIQLDFEYLFDGFQVEFYLVNDLNEISDLEITPDRLVKEIGNVSYSDLNEKTILICNRKNSFDEKKKLEKLGLVYKENFYYVEDFFYRYNPIFDIGNEKRLVIWGTGHASRDLYANFQQRSIEGNIDFFIDNNICNSDLYYGKKILHPSEIENWESLYIVIASYDFLNEIASQLKSYNLQEGVNYINFKTAVLDYSEMICDTVFNNIVFDQVCDRPFGTCDIIGDSVFVCCPNFLEKPIGSLSCNNFNDIWNSKIAKLLRLSVINGTYSFCDKIYCDLYKFDQKKEFDYNSRKLYYGKKALKVPSSLMVGIDATCNLQCPSCRKEMYVADEKKMAHMKTVSEDLLNNVIPYVDKFWLAGNGEVFYSQIYRDILQDERCSKRKSISILSNLTLFNEKNWKLLEGIYEHIDVLVSVDGVKKNTIELLRKGAKYESFRYNFEYLGRLRKEGKIDNLFVNCVIQDKNIAELSDLVKWCENNYVDKIQFLKLHNHGFYSDKEFDEMSLFDENEKVKDKYKKYFSGYIMESDIVDWFNSSKSLGVEPKPRMTRYDLT